MDDAAHRLSHDGTEIDIDLERCAGGELEARGHLIDALRIEHAELRRMDEFSEHPQA